MEYLGVNYLSDVDMMFEDANYFSYVFDTRYKNIQGLKIGAIKDFIPIQEEENDLFYLSNDNFKKMKSSYLYLMERLVDFALN